MTIHPFKKTLNAPIYPDRTPRQIFSDAWWKVYGRIPEECGKLHMGIGMSTLTIDGPNVKGHLVTSRNKP